MDVETNDLSEQEKDKFKILFFLKKIVRNPSVQGGVGDGDPRRPRPDDGEVAAPAQAPPHRRGVQLGGLEGGGGGEFN